MKGVFDRCCCQLSACAGPHRRLDRVQGTTTPAVLPWGRDPGPGGPLTHPLVSQDCLVNTARSPQSGRPGLQRRLLTSSRCPLSSVVHLGFLWVRICPLSSLGWQVSLSSWETVFLHPSRSVGRSASSPAFNHCLIWSVSSGHVTRVPRMWP